MAKPINPTIISGGCMCGSFRYTSVATPAFGLQCYCRNCQRITGTGHSSQFALLHKEVTMTGATSKYETKADSGNTVTVTFCSICGNPLYNTTNGYPQFAFFHAATLDDPSKFKPQSVEWVSCRQPWDLIDASLQRNI